MAVRASTAIAATVDGKTAIAAGKHCPELLWWELQGNVKVTAGGVGLAQLEHLAGWSQHHTQAEGIRYSGYGDSMDAVCHFVYKPKRIHGAK